MKLKQPKHQRVRNLVLDQHHWRNRSYSSEQAEKVFNDFKHSGLADPVVSGYNSHYDTSQNICYAETDKMEVLLGAGETEVLTAVITDAFSNSVYGRYASYTRNGTEEKPECWIKPPGRSESSCTSPRWYSLASALKYFGIDLPF